MKYREQVRDNYHEVGRDLYTESSMVDYILDEIEKRINRAISNLKLNNFSDCLVELEELAEDLF